MNTLPTWEIALLGIMAVGLIFLFRPGIKQALKQSAEAKDKDWGSVLFPLLFVVLFVILLISMV